MAKTRTDRIVALIQKAGVISTTDVAHTLRISRQAAHRRLRQLEDAGQVVHQGRGRTARWVVPEAKELSFDYSIDGLAEDRVWDTLLKKVESLRALEGASRSIAHYAVTEMLNNAIDHSESPKLSIAISSDPRRIVFEIRDFGIGAFENVRRRFDLASPFEALAELSKGKVTTQPERHSGEGIFFVSKAVERFELESNGVAWIVDNALGDMTVRSIPSTEGTTIRCVVPFVAARTLESLFADFTDDFEFTRTRTVVKLFAIGVEFVSRSHARRLLHGLERFREVVLDFASIEAIGQGFADEVFRVWPSLHPSTRLSSENVVTAVAFMIRRAQAPRQ